MRREGRAISAPRCEVCAAGCVGSNRFCDTHRREHAQQVREQINAVRARHARRLAAHESAAEEGLTGWDRYFRGERIFAQRERGGAR